MIAVVGINWDDVYRTIVRIFDEGTDEEIINKHMIGWQSTFEEDGFTIHKIVKPEGENT